MTHWHTSFCSWTTDPSSNFWRGEAAWMSDHLLYPPLSGWFIWPQWNHDPSRRTVSITSCYIQVKLLHWHKSVCVCVRWGGQMGVRLGVDNYRPPSDSGPVMEGACWKYCCLWYWWTMCHISWYKCPENCSDIWMCYNNTVVKLWTEKEWETRDYLCMPKMGTQVSPRNFCVPGALKVRRVLTWRTLYCMWSIIRPAVTNI